ncbi:MAG: hypothetical protein HZC55_18285 [Verrucomicrobia bacterium]|nr:hypothetical protein [Verrucomicrobiota bacterium]
MKALVLITTLLALGLVACERQVSPVTLDAPQLAYSLRWVGVCAVLCSTIGGLALVLATRNRRK